MHRLNRERSCLVVRRSGSPDTTGDRVRQHLAAPRRQGPPPCHHGSVRIWGILLAMLLCYATLSKPGRAGGAGSLPSSAKQRIVVMTDIGGDPDDRQSLVRFLLYCCDFDVEGFCTGFGFGHYQVTHPELIRDAIEAYGKVVGNLQQHRADYPSAARLLALVKDGHDGDPHKVGPGMDSEASDWIIKVIDRDDPRPVWFSIWGGPRELAQAIWKVSQTRTSEELAKFKKKIRVHSIADQDRTALWVKANHPDVFWIFSDRLFRGIWKAGDQDLVSPAWLHDHVLTNHGPLGPLYPPKAAGKDGVKEGDTPSFLYLAPNGLSDPEHPQWGNWGGRFRRSGQGNEYIPAEDIMDDRLDLLYTIHRWRRAYQNAFAARMDWCVQPYRGTNHEPKAVCNGDRSLAVLELDVHPNDKIRLTAAGSDDPDGDQLHYRWWIYREAGTYWDTARLDPPNQQHTTITIPPRAAGRSIHVILEVTDSGSPSLTAYRRVILHVSGKPIQPPPGALGAEPDLSTPVTKLNGPPEKDSHWTFWRGININGQSTEIDGHRWAGDAAEFFQCEDRPLDKPNIRLQPPTDRARAQMIRSSRWNGRTNLGISDVPGGTYAVYVYVWEETSPETFQIRLNGRIVEPLCHSGPAGRWQRLGPWIAKPDRGRLTITSDGGAANFSGVEIWRQTDAK